MKGEEKMFLKLTLFRSCLFDAPYYAGETISLPQKKALENQGYIFIGPNIDYRTNYVLGQIPNIECKTTLKVLDYTIINSMIADTLKIPEKKSDEIHIVGMQREWGKVEFTIRCFPHVIDKKIAMMENAMAPLTVNKLSDCRLFKTEKIHVAEHNYFPSITPYAFRTTITQKILDKKDLEMMLKDKIDGKRLRCLDAELERLIKAEKNSDDNLFLLVEFK